MSKPQARKKVTMYRETKDFLHFYDFVCEGCGAEGKLGVPVDEHQTFGCPEGCGATYLQWKSPLDSRPKLTCVVCPVFEPVNHEAEA